MVIVIVIIAMNTLFGAAAIVAILRAFGPPVLTITPDRIWVYRFPGRGRRFQLDADARIEVSRFGIRMSPPGSPLDGGKPVDRLNIRMYWMQTGTRDFRAALRTLAPSWTVEGK